MEEPLIIGFIGYSQTGKTTRIYALKKYAGMLGIEAAEEKPLTSVRIAGTDQSRHFIPHALRLRTRTRDLIAVTLDYTGHDHIAAYAIIKNMFEMLRREKDIVRKSYLERVINISNRLVDDIIIERKGIPQRVLKVLISDPLLYPKPGLEEKYDPFEYLYRIVVGAPYRPSEMASYRRRVIIELDSFEEYISFDDFNKLLCMLEAEEEDLAKCAQIGSVSEVEVKIRNSVSNIQRTIVTGPLLAYLLIGLMLRSTILFIFVPLSARYVRENVEKAFIGSKGADITHRVIFLRGIFGSGEKFNKVFARNMTKLTEGKISFQKSMEIAEACSKSVVESEVAELRLPKSAKKELLGVSPLISGRGFGKYVTCVEEALKREGIEGPKIIADALSDIWRAILERYQSDILRMLLSLSRLALLEGFKLSIKGAVLDYTYADKAGNMLYKLFRASLSPKPIKELDAPRAYGIIVSLKRLDSAIKRRLGRGIFKHYILSAMDEASKMVSPLEYLLLSCYLEDGLPTFVIEGKRGEEYLNCRKLIDITRLDV